MIGKRVSKASKLFLVLCCFVSVLTLQRTINVAAEESDQVIVLDDFDEGFKYSNGNANNGGWGSANGDSADASEHWANKAGASVEIKFNGTKLELYGKKAPNHRMFSVSIDGEPATEHDAYAEEKTDNNALLYSSEDTGITLEAKDHTAVLTVLEKANEQAQDALGMNIAYAKIFGGEKVEEVFPGYTFVEDNNITKTDELFKVKYNGAWDGGNYYDVFHGGTEHYAHNGDSFEVRFIGTKFEIWASKDPGHGDYTVTIDRQAAGMANATGSSRENQQIIYTSADLTEGEHTVKVELKDQPDQAIQLDCLKIYHKELAPTSISLHETAFTMAPGDVRTLTATIEPWVASSKDIVWTSSDPSALTVADGTLTAHKVSEKKTVTITARAAMDESISAEATITVDPTISFMNAYVGDEKLLDLSENYETLKNGEKRTYVNTAWRGDELNSKIIVATRGHDAKQVTLTASDFKNENGNVLSSENLEIKWLKEIKANVGRNRPANAPVKDFPDVIYKGGAKDIAVNDVAFAWVNMNVPKETPAGTYTGTITAEAQGLETPIVLSYTIEVLNLMQPAPEATELQVWQHPFAVANNDLGLGSKPTGGISNELQEDFYFTEEHFDLMRDSMKEYASIGGHDAVANIVEEAWGHQSYYSDPSMVKWTKKTDGTWEFDYTWYDRWVNFLIECGVLDPAAGIGQIKCYSIVPWSNQIAYYDEASGKIVKERHNPGDDSWKAMWDPFLEDFMAHSKEKGWFEITYISMDERGLDQLKPAVDQIEAIKDQAGNHFKISSALNYAAPEYYDFTDRIDDISINLGNIANADDMKASAKHRDELGLTTTFYTCTGDYPSNYIISDPGDNYWDIWYTMTTGTGYMRWAWDNYVYDMQGDVSYRYWEPGDGWFIYPTERDSEQKSFYSTPRYELFKQGIRDVAKAKYILNSPEVSESAKAELKEVVENLKVPTKGGSYGSAVAATEEDRMLVHSETARAMDATNKAARQLSDAKTADKTALQRVIKTADSLNEKDYTAITWQDLKLSLDNAQNVMNDPNATQGAVDQAAQRLQAAIDALDKITTPDPEDPTVPEDPSGQDQTVTLPNWDKNITVTGKLDPDASLVTRRLDNQAVKELSLNIKDALFLKSYVIDSIYDLSLMKEGIVIHLDGTVTVRIHLTEQQQKLDLEVFYFAPDGKVQKMPSTRKGDMIEFTTDHFSYYGLVYKKESSKTGNVLVDTGSTPEANLFLYTSVIGGIAAILWLLRKREGAEE